MMGTPKKLLSASVLAAAPRLALAVALGLGAGGLVTALGAVGAPVAGASPPKTAPPAPPAQDPSAPSPHGVKVAHTRGPSPVVQGSDVLPHVATAPTVHYVVDTTTDLALKTPHSTACVDTATSCSLRAAVGAADNAGRTGLVATITLPAGTYLLKTGSGFGALVIDASMVVHGASGATATVVSGQGKVEVLDIRTFISTSSKFVYPSVELSHLTVTDGATTGSGADIFNDEGGLTLSAVAVTGGKATDDGGGLYSADGSVWMDTGTSFTGDSARVGGALYSTYAGVVANGTTFSHNTASTDGGAIYQEGAMTAHDAVYSDNSAGAAGGAIYNYFTFSTTGGMFTGNSVVSRTSAYGGALDNAWEATVTGATFATTSVTATDYVYGGVVYNSHSLSLAQVAVSGTSDPCTKCTGGGIFGGVVANDGLYTSFTSTSTRTTTTTTANLTVTGLTVTGTTNGSATTSKVEGGVVLNTGSGFATIDGLDVSGTTDMAAAGAVDGGVVTSFNWASVRDMSIDSTTVSIAPGTGGGVYGGAVDLTTQSSVTGLDVSATTVTAGTSGEIEGGAVFVGYFATLAHLDVAGTAVTADGIDVFGGGLYLDSSTSLQDASITGTTVTDVNGSKGYVEGGGWYNGDEVSATGVQVLDTTVTAGQEIFGGAFTNSGDASTITSSTFAGVVATVDGTGAVTGAAVALNDLTTLVNVTMDAATAVVGPDAYGSVVYSDTIANLTNDTIADDTITSATGAPLTGKIGGIYANTNGPMYVKNTIVATTPADHNCAMSATTDQIVSAGGNIDSGTSCGFTQSTDQQGTDPLVAALGANGGPVETAALLPGSPAIDRGVSAGCPATDARGVPRPAGHCDVGAFQTSGQGYWEVASDGGIFAFGTAPFYGSMGATPLAAPVVGMAVRPDQMGYWEVAADGGIFAFGTARFHGSMGGIRLNAPVVGMAAEPQGGGYWEVASDGGIFSFGSANFYGSMGGHALNKPIVGIAAAPTGKGYWEVASDGGIFAFGSANFYGSMGGQALNKPIVALAATPTAQGYWEVASDGGIFAYGQARFQGSMGGIPLNAPVVGGAGFERL